MKEEFILRTEGLKKKYGEEYVLNDVSINIKKGEIYGLIGKNGAGKTTLMRVLAGLIQKNEGSIYINEKKDDRDIENERKRFGWLVETPSLYMSKTAFQNMEIERILKGIKDKNEIEQKLSIVGLLNTGNKKVKNFSLGMKQRLAIAMALIGDPEIIVLDEPINGLDPIGIIEMRNLLKRLNKDLKITIVISSHILSELYLIADSYGIINNGVLVEEISQEDLNDRCKKYVTIKTDNALKCVNELKPKYNNYKFETIDNERLNVFGDKVKVNEISAFLNEKKIEVYEIVSKSEDLEEFFIKCIGGR